MRLREAEPTISREFSRRARAADTGFYPPRVTTTRSRLTGRALLARKESLREIGAEPAERRRRRWREPTRAVVVPRPQVARHPPRRSHVRVKPRPRGHRAEEFAEGGEAEAGGEVGDGVVFGELEEDVEEREVDVPARPNARWPLDTLWRGADGWGVGAAWSVTRGWLTLGCCRRGNQRRRRQAAPRRRRAPRASAPPSSSC